MEQILNIFSKVISVVNIVTALVYFKFGAIPAAVAFVAMHGLKLVSESFGYSINTLDNLIRKIPILGNKLERILDVQSNPDLLDAHFRKYFANSEDPLLRGDLEAYAKTRWPASKHPELWVNIPKDIRRPVIIDGRLPDGSAPADTFYATAIDNKFVADSFKRAVIAALVVFVVTFFAWRPDMYFAKPIIESQSLVSKKADNGQQTHKLRADAWSNEERMKLTSETSSTNGKASDARSVLLNWVVASHGIMTAFSLAFLVFMINFRAYTNKAVQRRGQRISLIGAKEGITRWKRRLEKREIEHKAYLGQLATINNFDKTPTIKFGKYAGTTKFRGLLTAPEKGEDALMSLEDMSKNCLVLGGTGSGKTRSVLKPVISQFIELMKSGVKVGIYGTDGKAVLWQDIKEAAEAAGMGHKVIVIGCEEGEYGVDICDGMEPSLIGDTITSVLAQSSGNSAANDFWSDMGSQLIKNAATIARAWEMTVSGCAVALENGERLYSLSTIYKLCIDQKFAEQAVADISSSSPEKNPFGTQDLFDAMTYMTTTWPAIAEVTASGIRANVMNALGGFTFNVNLRRQFSSGAAEDVIELKDCWDNIVLVRISSLDYGTSGRLINILLKTKLYAAARQREVDSKKMSNKKSSDILDKLFQSAFLTDERKKEISETINLNDRLLFVADEFQDLITSSTKSLSDATFWNVSRSTGTIGLIATQSIATLEQAIGEKSAENFILQMRSKISLVIEDENTMNYIEKMAGKTFRWNVTKNEHYESWEAYKRELGEDSKLKPINLSELPKMGLLEKFSTKFINTHFGFNPGYDVDERFFGKQSTSTSTQGGTSYSSDGGEIERAYWRRDDKVESYMQSMEEHDAIDNDDLITMGGGRAYMYLQRGGAVRQDLVDLP